MDDNKIFYISCRGSSASTWLAKVLSRHQRIVAFRATRHLPPYVPGAKPNMPVEDFFDGLLQCNEATKGEKIFGSMHGYHGIQAKQACEERGGIFSFLTRHPVTKMGSYLVYMADAYYQENNLPVTNEQVLDHLSSLKRGSEFDDIFNCFSSGLESFFLFERQLFDACGPEGAIKMEQMVSDREYFRASIWPKVAPHIELEDAYLDDIYSVGRIGVHRKKPTTPQELWTKLPEDFRKEFLAAFNKWELGEICQALDYDVSWIPEHM